MPDTSYNVPLRVQHSATKQRPQFGAGGSGPLGGFLPYLEARPLAELVFKDIMAFNAPKIALARTWKERLDTATLELSNTSITLFSSLFLPRLLRQGVQHTAKVSKEDLAKKVSYLANELPKTNVRLGRMATSFGFFFPFAAAFWAAPFARNWLTMKRTKSGNFEELIGFGDAAKNAQSNTPKQTPQEEMAYQKNTALKVFGIGAALGAASLGGFSYLARQAAKPAALAKGKNALQRGSHKIIQWMKTPQGRKFFESYDLVGKGANQIQSGRATLIFWGLPAYAGWLHGARSDNERRERLLQSANALFWFFAASKLTGFLWNKSFQNAAGTAQESAQKWSGKFIQDLKKSVGPGNNFKKAFDNKVANVSFEEIAQHFGKGKLGETAAIVADRNKLNRLKTWKFALNDLGVPIVSLAGMQLLNFHITERKIKKGMQTAKPTQGSANLPLPSSVNTALRPIWLPQLQTQSGYLPLNPSQHFMNPSTGFQPMHPFAIHTYPLRFSKTPENQFGQLTH